MVGNRGDTMRKWIKRKLGIRDQHKLFDEMGQAILKDVDKADTLGNVHNVRDNHEVIEPLIEDLTETMWAQQEKVLQAGKYEHPVHPSNCNAAQWMRHQMEEMADALIYHECMIQTIEEVREEIKQARILNMQQVKSITRDRIDIRLSAALSRLGEENGE